MVLNLWVTIVKCLVVLVTTHLHKLVKVLAITVRTGVALVSADVLNVLVMLVVSNTVTYTPSVSAGNNTFTSITHTLSDLLNVFLNGVLLDSSDYTADANADTVAITSLASGDVVHIQVIGALDNSNFVPEWWNLLWECW